MVLTQLNTPKIQKEYKDIVTELEKNKLNKDKDQDIINIELINDDLSEWLVTLKAPPNTPYEGWCHNLYITFPADYPFKPPKVIFKTPILHPNISNSGTICLDLLKDNWSPALSITKLLISIRSLLSDPNPVDPLSPEIAKIYLEDKDKYNELVKSHTERYSFKK